MDYRDPQLAARIDRRTLLAHGARTAAALAAGSLFGRGAFAADEVKIGWIQPTTGALASSFGPLYLAADMALEEINAAGGILGRKLVKVTADDEGSPAKEPIVTRRLIDDGCRFILGPVGSSQALASLEVSTAAKVIQATYASATEMGDGKRYPYHYQFNFTTDAQAVSHAAFLQQRGFKKIGLLVEDSAAGAGLKASAMKEIPAHGMQIVSVQEFPLKVADMTPFLRKLRADGAEALEAHVSNNVDITQMLVGLARIGWKPVIAGHTGFLFAGTPGAVPDNARYNDVYAATFKALTYSGSEQPPERVKAFVRKIAASNVSDTLLGPAATTPFYDFLYALKYGVEKAKSWDTEAIKKALDSSSDIPGLFGPMKFTATNHTAYDASVVAMAVANSMEDPLSKEYRGLFRRRAGGAA
ncbi:ABC transporter substrate-binding protein [Ramlibacter sp. G-1-2-2]|uniref:ABC transporter substrate-binding protein n=1 Tax=Ramlibacter agri TaxID=2728837 RepID=A0A848H9V0_9BURK|nr:ABC transporter substrate-binding protein [Ramlibacter agri]NML47257.1 ABC transporter substrate-binding protein [Ramlibacter agri]